MWITGAIPLPMAQEPFGYIFKPKDPPVISAEQSGEAHDYATFDHGFLDNDVPDYDDFTKTAVLYYFSDTVFPEPNVFPRPELTEAEIETIVERVLYVRDVPRTYEECAIVAPPYIEAQIEKWMTKIRNALATAVKPVLNPARDKFREAIFRRISMTESVDLYRRLHKKHVKKMARHRALQANTPSLKYLVEAVLKETYTMSPKTTSYKIARNNLITYATGRERLSKRLLDAMKTYGTELFVQSWALTVAKGTKEHPITGSRCSRLRGRLDEADAMAARFAAGTFTQDDLARIEEFDRFMDGTTPTDTDGDDDEDDNHYSVIGVTGIYVTGPS